MTDFLETTVDKFTLKVKKGLLYHPDGLWVRLEGGEAVVGVTDYLQMQSGDVTFVDVPNVGSTLKVGQTMGGMETMKVTLDLICPVNGKVVAANGALEKTPELLNEDPYGEGWLVRMAIEGEPGDLLTADAYFEVMKTQAAQA